MRALVTVTSRFYGRFYGTEEQPLIAHAIQHVAELLYPSFHWNLVLEAQSSKALWPNLKAEMLGTVTPAGRERRSGPIANRRKNGARAPKEVSFPAHEHGFNPFAS